MVTIQKRQKSVLTKVLYSGTKVSVSRYRNVRRKSANIELALLTFSLMCWSNVRSLSIITPISFSSSACLQSCFP